MNLLHYIIIFKCYVFVGNGQQYNKLYVEWIQKNSFLNYPDQIIKKNILDARRKYWNDYKNSDDPPLGFYIN